MPSSGRWSPIGFFSWGLLWLLLAGERESLTALKLWMLVNGVFSGW
jgi:hypothetical protein